MIKVVLADDHAVVRQALGEMLTAHGKFYVSALVASGEEALDIVVKEQPDALVMDIEMPGMGGIAAIRELKANGSAVPVLVLSANDNPQIIREALKAGAHGFVPKNADIDELEFAIAAVAEGKTYLSPAITASLMSETAEIDTTNPLARLSSREREVLIHLANGRPNRETAGLLHISIRTVDTHRTNILKKLGLKTNAELVKLAIASRLISL